MTEQEIKDLMYSRGYSLSMTGGNRKTFSFDKWYEDFMLRPTKSILEADFVIGCTVDTDTKFEFTFATKCWTFQFRSSSMSSITREDFDKIESSFAHYCRALNSNNPF